MEIERPVSQGSPEQNREAQLRRMLRELEGLPPLPSVIGEIVEAVEDPTISANQLSEVIERDVALAARVLKLVNSAWYGQPRKVGSIQHGVVILGFKELRNLAVAACMMDTYPLRGGQLFSPDEFWRHSIAVASRARDMARSRGLRSPQRAFVAGLLHDIGKVAFDLFVPERFDEALAASRCEDDPRPLAQCELELIGIDHPSAGAALARQWNLPDELASALLQHHSPSAGIDAELTDLVHLANVVVHRSGQGHSGNAVPDLPDPGAMARLGISEQELDTP